MTLPPGDLNPNPFPQHPTSICTCEVTSAPRVHGSNYALILSSLGRGLFCASMAKKYISLNVLSVVINNDKEKNK